jgi:ABC-type Fe3+ transport system permease subunit
MAGPMLAAGAIVLVMALQEFAVYEKSGISVVATEVRTVFETGASSLGDSATIAGVVAGSGLADQAQARRAAAAVATGLPALALVAVLVLVAFRFAMRMPTAERVDVSWPSVLDARWASITLALLVVVLTLVMPTAAMIGSISPQRWRVDSAGHLFVTRIWLWAEPYVLGTLLYGGLAAVGALCLAILTTVHRAPAALMIALAAFLVGGELLAIADIRLFSGVRFIYNKPPMMMIAYVGQFGWLAILAGRLTWGRSYRELRDMAAVDGAGPWRAAIHVIVPMAGATLVAAAGLVMVLAMTEVSATVLLSPARPQTLIVFLMGYIHLLRYDEMLEGCLLLMGMAGVF